MVFKDRDRPVEQTNKTSDILNFNDLLNTEIISVWEDFIDKGKDKYMKRFFGFFPVKQLNDFQRIDWIENKHFRERKKSTLSFVTA